MIFAIKGEYIGDSDEAFLNCVETDDGFPPRTSLCPSPKPQAEDFTLLLICQVSRIYRIALLHGIVLCIGVDTVTVVRRNSEDIACRHYLIEIRSQDYHCRTNPFKLEH